MTADAHRVDGAIGGIDGKDLPVGQDQVLAAGAGVGRVGGRHRSQHAAGKHSTKGDIGWI